MFYNQFSFKVKELLAILITGTYQNEPERIKN